MDNENVIVQPEEQAEQKEKKKSKLPFIITIIIILLLFSLAAIYMLLFVDKTDSDIAIAKLINENVKTTAANSYEGYTNSKGIGYVLDDLLLSKESRVIVWDSKNDCYALYDGSELIYSPAKNPSSGTDLWVFVDELPDASSFSVYYTGTNKVTRQETVGEKLVDRNYYYSDHVYNVTVNGDSQTYTCTEDGCNYSYTVKVAK